MYKYTFKMFLAELLATAFGMLIGLFIMSIGWYALELRNGAMFACAIVSALIGVLPFFATLSLR